VTTGKVKTVKALVQMVRRRKLFDDKRLLHHGKITRLKSIPVRALVAATVPISLTGSDQPPREMSV
jgi:hypothetical protein